MNEENVCQLFRRALRETRALNDTAHMNWYFSMADCNHIEIAHARIFGWLRRNWVEYTISRQICKLLDILSDTLGDKLDTQNSACPYHPFPSPNNKKRS